MTVAEGTPVGEQVYFERRDQAAMAEDLDGWEFAFPLL